MELEIMLLREVRHTETTVDIAYLWNLKKKKVQMNVFIRQKHTQRRENSLMIAKGKGKEG